MAKNKGGSATETLQKQYESLKTTVTNMEEDVTKVVNGNKAAGTRVRKAVQEIKTVGQEMRKTVLECKGTD